MKTSSLFTVLSVFTLLASRGEAADQKRMHANACELEYDDENQNYDRGGARIGSLNGYEQNFVCPLLRSNTTNTNGLSSLSVNLFKAVPTVFTCYADSSDQYGSFIKSVMRSTTRTGLTSVSWGSALNAGGARGSYAVSCHVVGAAPSAQWGDELYSIDYVEP